MHKESGREIFGWHKLEAGQQATGAFLKLAPSVVAQLTLSIFNFMYQPLTGRCAAGEGKAKVLGPTLIVTPPAILQQCFCLLVYMKEREKKNCVGRELSLHQSRLREHIGSKELHVPPTLKWAGEIRDHSNLKVCLLCFLCAWQSQTLPQLSCLENESAKFFEFSCS
eukprot:scaffold95287_cov17-Tisochrysis_lutea.AAC.1